MRIALPYAGQSPEQLSAVCSTVCHAGCCRGPVAVLLRQEEVARLQGLAASRNLSLTIHEDSAGGHFVHNEHAGEQCPFLTDEATCSIYDERPNACRNYPHAPNLRGCYLSGWEPKPQVFVATVHGKQTPVEFLTMRDVVLHHLQQAGQYAGHTASSSVRVDQNRNLCVEGFLKSKADYLLFLDDDMTFPPDVGVRLASHGKDIVAGLYFQRGQEQVYPHWYRSIGPGSDAYGQTGELYRSLDETVYRLFRDAPYHDDAMTREGKDLVPLDAAGTGCVLIHRRVLETMPAPWFRTEGAVNGDLHFFTKARALGFEVWGDPGVTCGHYRYSPIGVGTFRRHVEQAQRAAQGLPAERSDAENCNTADYWDVVHGDEVMNGYRRSYPGTDAVYQFLLGHVEHETPVVVDFGCGRAQTYERLRESRPTVRYAGLDHSRVAIEDNRKAYPDAQWLVADLRTAKLQAEQADLCLSSEVIEHLDDPDDLLRQMWRAVAPGGYLAVGAPIGEIEGAPPGEHVQVFTLDDLIARLTAYGSPVWVFPGDGPRKVLAVQKPIPTPGVTPEKALVTA